MPILASLIFSKIPYQLTLILNQIAILLFKNMKDFFFLIYV